jgi:transcriptional regulator with XRE-family HTH domain
MKTNKDIEALKAYIEAHRTKESFPIMLNRLREEKGMKASELYTKAGVQRAYYSKIMSPRVESKDPKDRKPPNVSKNIVIAFGLSLRLNRTEMDALLASANFAFNPNSLLDVAVMYWIDKGLYDFGEIRMMAEDLCADMRLKKHLDDMSAQKLANAKFTAESVGGGFAGMISALSSAFDDENAFEGAGSLEDGLSDFSDGLTDSFNTLADQMDALAASLALTDEEQEAVDSMTDEERELAAPYIATLDGIADILNNAALDIAGIDVGE